MNTDSLVQEDVDAQSTNSLCEKSEVAEASEASKVKSGTEPVTTGTDLKMDASLEGVAELQVDTDKKVIDQIGRLTRNLHNSLRELGYDKRLESLAAEAPKAQDKLSYVAMKTEEAADRTLNATEIARPIQEKLSEEATQLSEKWLNAFDNQRMQPDPEKFKMLLIETLSYLNNVPNQTNATNMQLMEIMMAQDFQDLTGQVIKKITQMVQRLEHDLVQILLTNVSSENKQFPTNKQLPEDTGLLNGPLTDSEKSADTVHSQDQVDDLLASLGF